MRLIWNYLIPAYFTALDGNIIIDGDPLPICDGQVTPDVEGSYILLGARTYTQTKSKGRYNGECTLLIDVVIKGPNYGFKDSEDAAEQITELINSDNNPVCSSNFQVVSTSVLSTNNLPSINPTDNIFRTLIRYRHLVNEI